MSAPVKQESAHLDIAANRRSRKYERGELVRRLFWSVGSMLFRLVPRPLFVVRCGLLRLFGARVGRGVHVYPTVRIFAPWRLQIGDWSAVGDRAVLYDLGDISIGRRVTISQHAHLCAGTHDHSDPAMPLLKPPIRIEDDAWICADAFVGPGVTVGRGAVVAARAVSVRDVADWTIVAGNPAVTVKQRELKAQAQTMVPGG